MRLANSPQGIDRVWHAFLFFWNFDRASLFVSIFALAVSAWVAFISRRNTEAAERSAEAAEKQAKVALDQARDASYQAVLAADTSEASALETARARIDQSAPSAVVAISYINQTPLLAESCSQVPVPHPKVERCETLKLAYEDHWHCDVYFLLRGTIYNDGDRVIRIYAHGPTFYSGSHPLTDEEVLVPQWTIPDFYILHPGQMALFQMLAWKQVDDWLQLREEKDRNSYPLSWFLLMPGSTDEPHVIINVKAEGHPVKRQIDESGDWIILKPWCYVRVTTEIERQYPTSFEWLYAELKNDQEALRWLRRHEEISRSFDEKRKHETESG